MKITKTVCCLLWAATMSTPMFAQEDAKMKKPSPEEAAMMAAAAPGKMHEMLAKSNGMWNEDVTFWMTPDAPPEKMTATCINRMVMGGRYQQGQTRGSINGMPFEGMSTTGYDNQKKVFVSTWIDNMGTGIMYMEGPYNEATKSVEMKGSMTDPMSGQEIAMRETWKMVDDNNQLMEMYSTPKGGKEFKTMEIKFTKKEMDRQPMPPGGPGGRPMPAPNTPPVQNDHKQDVKPADKK